MSCLNYDEGFTKILSVNFYFLPKNLSIYLELFYILSIQFQKSDVMEMLIVITLIFCFNNHVKCGE